MIAWDITHDYIESGKVGTTVRESESLECHVPDSDWRFKILDDDGIVYYRGRCTDDSWEDLMDWAMAYAGATEIWGRQGNNKYEMIIG